MAQETENMPKKYEHEDFLILDTADEQQIAEADQNLKNALVYDLKGKKELSYIGLKHLVLMMSRKGDSLKIIDKSLNLVDGIWYASITFENTKTGYQAIGLAEQPQMMDTKDGKVQDHFARIKAMSKAERNAWRKQIPELQLKTFIDLVLQKNPEKKQTLNEAAEHCGCSFDEMELTADEGGCRKCHKKVSDIKRNEYKRRKSS